MNKKTYYGVLSSMTAALLMTSCYQGVKSNNNDLAKVSLVIQAKDKGVQIKSAPATVPDFTCLFLNVKGGAISTVQNLGLVSSQISIQNGGVLQVEVPKSSGLTFQVVGVVTASGCSNASREALLSTTTYPVMATLGTTTADIAGDTQLTINSSYSSSAAVDLRTGETLNTTPAIGEAPVRPEGHLGGFTDSGQTLPIPLQGAAAVETGGKLLIIGGYNRTLFEQGQGVVPPVYSSIYQAAISADGQLGTIAESNYNLNVARAYPQAHIIGSYLYVFGGMGVDGSALSSIERAPVDANGLSGPFTVLSETMASGRYSFASVVTRGYVYIIGGRSGGPALNTIERATLNTTTGTIGNFEPLTRTVVSGSDVTNGLIQERATHNSFRLGNNYYILGGESSGSLSSIEKAVIQDDGTLGNFVTESITLATARNRLSVIAMSGKAYLYQGWAGGFLSSVEVADITDNTLGNFSTLNGVTLNVAVEDAVSLLTSSAVFIIGGYNNTGVKNTIQRAPIIR